MSVTVLLVDDHRAVREGLRAMLPAEEFEIVAEASTARDAVLEAGRRRPDIVVLDLNLPDQSGVGACVSILEVSPTSAVVMLSAYADDKSVNSALRAGAKAYLLKDAEDLELTTALRRVLQGESVISPRAATALVRGLGLLHGPTRLSEQELNILQLVAQGLTNPEIGKRMHLSRHTVKEYLGNAMRKLGVNSRVEAVLKASRAGLIDKAGEAEDWSHKPPR